MNVLVLFCACVACLLASRSQAGERSSTPEDEDRSRILVIGAARTYLELATGLLHDQVPLEQAPFFSSDLAAEVRLIFRNSSVCCHHGVSTFRRPRDPMKLATRPRYVADEVTHVIRGIYAKLAAFQA